jgi:DNA-binding response OmpR family regulator
MHILVVDDEADIRSTVKLVLEKAGFKVTTAVSADDCLKKLKSIKPDFILLDIMMPGTPVKEAIPQIKQKIALFTALRTSEADRAALMKNKNVVGLIQKPFDVDDLVAKIKKFAKK